MDPATDQYYRWLTIIAIPVFYNLMMIVTRYGPAPTVCDRALGGASTTLKTR